MSEKVLIIWCVFNVRNRVMDVHGIYTSEQKAIDNCQANQCVGAVEVNSPIPFSSAEFYRCWYPHHQTWEQSREFEIQSRAKAIVADFFKRSFPAKK